MVEIPTQKLDFLPTQSPFLLIFVSYNFKGAFLVYFEAMASAAAASLT